MGFLNHTFFKFAVHFLLIIGISLSLAFIANLYDTDNDKPDLTTDCPPGESC